MLTMLRATGAWSLICGRCSRTPYPRRRPKINQCSAWVLKMRTFIKPKLTMWCTKPFFHKLSSQTLWPSYLIFLGTPQRDSVLPLPNENFFGSQILGATWPDATRIYSTTREEKREEFLDYMLIKHFPGYPTNYPGKWRITRLSYGERIVVRTLFLRSPSRWNENKSFSH